MKFLDMLKLVAYEYRYEKKEWILSLILQCLAFLGVFFLFSLAGDIDRVCGEYLSPLYPNGYAFNLTGYSETDSCGLEKIGFQDIAFSSATGQGYAITDSLSGIWGHKLHAVFTGKDIWSDGLDEILSIIFFCQITLGMIGIALFFVMINNLENSVAMKLMRRQRYIRMLGQLGCPRAVCREIYYIFVAVRSTGAFLMAICLNGFLVYLLNGYLEQNMYMQADIAVFRWTRALGIWILSMFSIGLCFRRQWRRNDES